MEFKDYKRCRWFFTSSGNLVVGGKSAEQNDSLLKKLKTQEEDFVVMHTSTPGSPFSILLAEKKSVSKSDLEECAIFTACFSQQWKSGKKSAEVDVFNLSQLSKPPLLKTGTWSVKGRVKKIKVPLELVLVVQKNKLRAVPEITSHDFFLKIIPGKVDKEHIISKLMSQVPIKFSRQDYESALPSGGFGILKDN